MRRTIVFFDIDGVIFDARRFFTSFCEKFTQENNLNKEEAEKLQNLYREVKKEKGFFDPQVFLAQILSQYSVAKENLERLWWNEESFQKCLLINEDSLKKIQEKAIVGIFSKGEINFQKKKIEKFNSLLNPQDIYIFEDKIIKINEVLAQYKDYKIYIVDDDPKVLESFKQANNIVFTILVKKGKTEIANSQIDAVIENPLQITPLLTQ
jgi:phosphoglycolate phosphatase-like HAD superfamily hydrolase